MNRALSALIGIIVIIAILYVVANYVFVSHPSGPPSLTITAPTQAFIQLTDPPSVPSGTQKLEIYYSSMGVHAVSSSGAQWYYSNTSGSTDLMRLQNVTSTIGAVTLPTNATINRAVFYISNASITINGTIYPVVLPSDKLSVNVSGTTSGGNVSVVLDLSPAVVTIFTANSTVFVMVPSVRAVVVPGAGTLRIGSTERINNTVKGKLEDVKPNISITSATLSTSGNITRISVTVLDNSNASVMIRHVMIFGNTSLNIGANANAIVETPDQRPENAGGNAGIGESLGINATVLGNALNASSRGKIEDFVNGTLSGIGNITGLLNSSERESFYRQLAYNISMNYSSVAKDNISEVEDAIRRELGNSNISVNYTLINRIMGQALSDAKGHYQARIEDQMKTTRVINFLVYGNSTLSIPFSEDSLNGSAYGYLLAPGKTATFSFNGTVSVGNDLVSFGLVPKDTYLVRVVGEEGAEASSNITAS